MIILIPINITNKSKKTLSLMPMTLKIFVLSIKILPQNITNQYLMRPMINYGERAVQFLKAGKMKELLFTEGLMALSMRWELLSTFKRWFLEI